MKQYQQVCVSGFLLNDKNQVLMVKRSMSDDFLPGYWEVPGGGLDFGEKPQEGLVREMKEEIGVDVIVGKPLQVSHYFMENGEDTVQRVEIFFACRKKGKNQEIQLSNEHLEYKWIGKETIGNIEMSEFMTEVMKTYFQNS